MDVGGILSCDCLVRLPCAKRSLTMPAMTKQDRLDGMTVCFAGSGEFGVPTLAALLDLGAKVLCVYSQPDKPAGRGSKLTPTPVSNFAIERGLNLIRTADLNVEPMPDCDVLVVIAFGQKINDDVISRPRLGAVNLHASRLPKYRGAAPIHWAVINGDAIAGNSVIRLAQRMDAGSVLAMSSVEVPSSMTTGELHEVLSKDGAVLVPRVLSELQNGTSKPIEQDHTQATRAPKLTRQTSLIDWNRSSTEIANLIRGLFPWPGCRVRLMDGEQPVATVTLVRVIPHATQTPSIPGVINDAGQVITGSGTIEIVEIQPQGGRVMTLAAFRNGKPWVAGMRLESVE